MRIRVVCIVGVALNLWIACALLLPGAWSGRNDFLGLYAGAKLSGTRDLYSAAAVRETQLRAAGETGESLRFSRLPYYGLLLKPLGWLPYRAAFWVWVALGAGALTAFAWLWPGGAGRWVMLCWFLPAFVAIFNGQDAQWLILWAAVAAVLVRKGRPEWAGVALAMCASKYHLAILLPVAIVAQRRWRVAMGAAAAGVAMLAVSFATAGWSWIDDYRAVLTDPRLHPSVLHMPSLHGFGMPVAVEAAGVVLLAVCVWLAARAGSFEWGVAAALGAGVLVGFHTYLSDCVVLLPAAILALRAGALRMPAIALATPIPWMMLQLPTPLPHIARLVIFLLVAGMAVTRGDAGTNAGMASLEACSTKE